MGTLYFVPQRLVDSFKTEMANLEPELDPNQCCIYRVPEDLRSINERAYTPQLVSIGPLHHGNLKLAKMEKIKRNYMKSFLQRLNLEIPDDILKFMQGKDQIIRNCYAETSTLDVIEYALMILYDAIFIIELFLRYNFGGSDLLLSTSTVKTTLCRDFQLLENQLPYFVLEKIYELAFAGLNMPTFMELSYSFFHMELNLELSRLTPQVEVKHLTDWRRTTILEHYYQRSEQINGWISDLPCAVKLHELGVKFNCLEGEHSLIDIGWKKPKHQIPCFEVLEMKIPHLKISKDTESLLRNVMALEQCHYPQDTHVCNYVRLMDYLIDTEKDVELLVENRIISNSLGDNASVANMFNKLSQCISLGPSSYYKICEELKHHCNNPWNWNRRKEILKRVYFNNLWKGTTSVAAVLLLLLTIIQTICSVLQVV